MPKKRRDLDPYIGLEIGKFKIVEKIGGGQVGQVYKAVNPEIDATRACKFIKEPREGWQNEITKVTRLGTVRHVVPYIDHDWVNVDNKKVLCIQWRYIPGRSLRAIAENKELSVSLLVDVVTAVLEVLRVCQPREIQHADLHWGNILIQDPDEFVEGSPQDIWVTDFGYLTASMGKELLNDFLGLSTIISQCVDVIDFHALDSAQRYAFRILKHEFPKYLHETSRVEHSYARNAAELYNIWAELNSRAEDESRGAPREKRIDDYMAAEMIGDRWEEWKALFVPNCLGISELTSRNITVLTGVRGCGKSMVFRRLTALYDFHLGPSKVPGADSFLGFYLLARYMAEAFPWLPPEKEPLARDQIIHYFHVCWCLEIFDWLENLADEENGSDCSWLANFFSKRLPKSRRSQFQLQSQSLRGIKAFFASEREKSRLHTDYEPSSDWTLSAVDFLSQLWALISSHVPAVNGLPMYCFLDDYSTPLVNSTIQRILNPIVFSRRSNVYFKISTEDVWSFDRTGLGGKLLEEDNDFFLVNVSTESLLLKNPSRAAMISDLLAPRIQRHKKLQGLSLERIMGKTPYSFNELAWALRGQPRGKFFSRETKARVEYGGAKVFSAIWSSDTREIIKLFSVMINQTESELDNALEEKREALVPLSIQDEVLREAGGAFVSSRLASATSPLEGLTTEATKDRSYGEHLCKIAKAFQEITKHELLNVDSQNEGRVNPKQARRIEITDTNKALPEELDAYYLGLLRYGVFIRDYRGKSVRKRVAPRLILRGLLIPYFTISFSRKDNIAMSWEQFCALLEQPDDAFDKWKQAKRKGHKDQMFIEGIGPKDDAKDDGS